MELLFHLLLLHLLLALAATKEILLDDGSIIITPNKIVNSNVEALLFIIKGANISPKSYVTLALQIQATSPLKHWISIPQIKNNMTNPVAIEVKNKEIIAKLEIVGMKAQKKIYAGHSEGGAMLQLWTPYTKDTVDAQILLGSFITRAFKNDYHFSYPVPTLTVGAELDGLCRVTRIAEAYYTQLIDPYNVDIDSNNKKFPVTIISGASHMQFASGIPPDFVYEHDLAPEISYDEAHELIAQDMSDYMSSLIIDAKDSEESMTRLQTRLKKTATFVNPIIEALNLEGYHNFRPPCLCNTDNCDASSDCNAMCPWTDLISQRTMGGGLDGLTINNRDSQHDVWETNPVHLPAVLNNCTSPVGCVLSTQTVTQVTYHTGEDLEIWKKHFDVPFLDTGFSPIAAFELRTKMSSRQQIYTEAGLSNVDFDSVDGGNVRCGEINQKAIDWAYDSAGENTNNRFSSIGQPFIIGPDKPVCPAGPCFIWEELERKESEDGKSIVVTAPFFDTPIDFWLPMTRGFHYCKVLSPAMAIEHMYVDGLRKFGSLKAQAKL